MAMVDIVTEVLNVLRRRRRGHSRADQEEFAYDERDVREVFKAIDQAGFSIVSKGTLRALKELATKL